VALKWGTTVAYVPWVRPLESGRLAVLVAHLLVVEVLHLLVVRVLVLVQLCWLGPGPLHLEMAQLGKQLPHSGVLWATGRLSCQRCLRACTLS
jgi:hypothetical protein